MSKLNSREYEIGQQVFRWYPPKANQKRGQGWTGPYTVVRKLSDITYEIQNETDGKLKIVHVDHLKRVVLSNVTREDSDLNVGDCDDSSSDNDDTDVAVFPYHNENEIPSITYNMTGETETVSPKYSRRGKQIKPPVTFSP
jgi:hypothetical protein